MVIEPYVHRVVCVALQRLGVDHRDAAPVDLDAWNHLELPEEV